MAAAPHAPDHEAEYGRGLDSTTVYPESQPPGRICICPNIWFLLRCADGGSPVARSTISAPRYAAAFASSLDKPTSAEGGIE